MKKNFQYDYPNLSKYANKLCRLVFKSEIKDQTSGFRLLNKKVINEIINFNPKLNGYAFLVEITNFTIRIF